MSICQDCGLSLTHNASGEWCRCSQIDPPPQIQEYPTPEPKAVECDKCHSLYDERNSACPCAELTTLRAQLASVTEENARLTRELGEAREAMRMEVIDSAKLESRIARLRAEVSQWRVRHAAMIQAGSPPYPWPDLEIKAAACDAHHDLDEPTTTQPEDRHE